MRPENLYNLDPEIKDTVLNIQALLAHGEDMLDMIEIALEKGIKAAECYDESILGIIERYGDSGGQIEATDPFSHNDSPDIG
jgi:hypothetical protein